MSFLVELPQSEYNRNAFAQFAPTGGLDDGTGTALAMAWMSQLAYETRLPDKIRAIGALFGLAEVRILKQPAKSTLPLSDTRGIIANKDECSHSRVRRNRPAQSAELGERLLPRPTERRRYTKAFRMRPMPSGRRSEQPSNGAWKRSRPLFVTGHSLGAAIALATVDRARREKGLD